MEGYSYETYGQRIADSYDDMYGEMFDVEATVKVLAELAGKGPTLELAIGTGRIALPLKLAGVDVSGIDISEEMVAKMREKEGGADIPVTMGDFATVPVEGTYSLVYLVFNTIFGLTTQEEQITCFRNVAEHLSDDGCFVVEAFVPDLTRFVRDQRLSTLSVDASTVQIDATRHVPAKQNISASHVIITEEGIKLYPVELRYIWPSEMDLMARLAGLKLEHRWGGWHKEPFESSSDSHVSVYRKG